MISCPRHTVGIRGRSFSLAGLVVAGVRRISLATSLYRASMSGLGSAAREVKERGTFSYVDEVLTSAEMSGYLRSLGTWHVIDLRPEAGTP
jgi:2-methylisocitrate lyase-like PEP mutase family enzyme